MELCKSTQVGENLQKLMTAKTLRQRIKSSLRKQGFQLSEGGVFIPVDVSKETLRTLHSTAVSHQREKAKRTLGRNETELLTYVADGNEVSPAFVQPRVRLVGSGTFEELLFRYLAHHWAIPISSGYGRRLRFLITDDYNGKVMGIIGLADPVISVGSRDAWIGWPADIRNQRLRHVMDAFVLGAVPPYSQMLCGKLVALLATGDTVRKAFKKKYKGTVSQIRKTEFDGRLALITTMSALGRSSIYNRLKYRDQLAFQSLGFSKGSGEFHFSNGLYGAISAYAKRYCEPTYKKSSWGDGFRNRREVVRKCLAKVSLKTSWSYHGIAREIFAAPLAENTRQFLRGEHSKLRWFDRSDAEISRYVLDRWILPRTTRDDSYQSFRKESYRLWP